MAWEILAKPLWAFMTAEKFDLSPRCDMTQVQPFDDGFGWGATARRLCKQAVLGGRGFGEAVDYRGMPVMAAWTYLPSFRWGLEVKQDRKEAFARSVSKKRQCLTLLGVTGLLVLLGAILLAQAIAKPLRGTATVARRIATDHLTARMTDYGTSTNEAAAAVNEISATSQELLRTMNEVNQLASKRRRWPRPARKAWAAWTGRCGSSPSRRARSAPSSR